MKVPTGVFVHRFAMRFVGLLWWVRPVYKDISFVEEVYMARSLGKKRKLGIVIHIKNTLLKEKSG